QTGGNWLHSVSFFHVEAILAAGAQLSILRRARTVNGRTATGLKLAMGFEVGAVAALAVSAILVLTPVGTPTPSALIRVTTASETFCGTLTNGDNGALTIDDEFRHSTQTVPDANLRSER